MTTAYTSLLGLALPVTGELSGTWGDTVNNSITSLLDTSVAGTTNVSTDTDVTLTTTTGAANTARQAILLFSGARTALRTITAPAQSKIYTVINATTGGFSVKLVGAGPTTGLTIPNGASAVVAWNGSDFVEIGAGSIGNLIVNGTLTVTGATTLQSTLAVTGNITNTAGTANGVTYLNGSKVLTSGSALTFDGSNFKLTGSDNNNLVYSANSNGTTSIRMQSNAAGNYLVAAGADPLYFQNGNASGVMVFAPASSTEQMRLTSTGLGIGTSSPSAKLDVTGTAAISGAVTLSGGTANGVLYLNGSKVVTSGSALTYDGNTFSSSSSTTPLSVNRTGSGTAQIELKQSGVAGSYIGTTGTNSFLIFDGSANELARFNSTGLGIGTTSSGAKLDAAGTVRSTANTNPSSGSGAEMSWDGTNGSFLAYNRTSSAWLPAQVLGSTAKLIAQTSDVTVGTATGTNAIFTTNGTERARIDSSGNFGIGTSSPTVRLDVSSAVTNGYTPIVRITRPSASLNDQFLAFYNGIGTDAQIGRLKNSDNLLFGFNSGVSFATSMTLDTSGNLGLGVTPSAWISNYKVLQSGNGSSFVGFSGNNQTFVVSNAYNDGAWKYIQTSGAGYYNIGGVANGQHSWFVAPSGTAGNAITFTQAMTLTAAGKLGIGDTSPTAQLDVFAGQGTQLRVRGTSTRNSSSVLSAYQDDTNGGKGTWGSNAYTATTYSNTLSRYDTNFSGWAIVGGCYGALYTANDNLSFNYVSTAGATSEFARFNDLGNYGLGIIPNRWFSNRDALQLGGSVSAISAQNGYEIGLNFYVAETTAAEKRVQTGYTNKIYADAADGDIRFAAGGTGAADSSITWSERMRLTTGGQLLVGTTTTSGAEVARFQTASGATSIGIIASTTGSSFVNFGDTSDANVGFIGYDHTNNYMNFRTNSAEAMRIDSSGNLLVGTTSGSNHVIKKAVSVGGAILEVIGNNVGCVFYNGDGGTPNAANAPLKVWSVGATGRSINAAGTINASGADYAEYMTKAGDFTVAKGDVVGIDAQGKLTNVFANAVSFVVKSTNPSYVGGDTWGGDIESDELEAARKTVDRIAFAGQVPVNVLGASAGQYIVPINDNGAIKGQAVSNPTFEQYQSSVGKVIAIEADGRARIIVKVA